MIRPRHLIGTAVLAGAFTAPGCLSQAVAAPNCGGQSAAPQPVPYTCNLPGIDITAQGVTRHFSAVVTADGTHVTVQFVMSAPLPVAVPIRIVHHVGISGAGGPESEASGVIPAGQTTATLVDSAPCRDGQLDVKAVFTGNGQSQGRVGGPWIQNGVNCGVIPTTTTSPTTTTASSSTTVPPATSTIPGSTAPVESSAPTSPSSSTVAGGTTLPATGSDALSTLCIGFTAGAIGWSLVLLARRWSA